MAPASPAAPSKTSLCSPPSPRALSQHLALSTPPPLIPSSNSPRPQPCPGPSPVICFYITTTISPLAPLPPPGSANQFPTQRPGTLLIAKGPGHSCSDPFRAAEAQEQVPPRLPHTSLSYSCPPPASSWCFSAPAWLLSFPPTHPGVPEAQIWQTLFSLSISSPGKWSLHSHPWPPLASWPPHHSHTTGLAGELRGAARGQRRGPGNRRRRKESLTCSPCSSLTSPSFSLNPGTVTSTQTPSNKTTEACIVFFIVPIVVCNNPTM